MQGLIAQGMQTPEQATQEAPPEQATQEAPGQTPQYKSKVIDAIPPEMRKSFEVAVLAGMKIMYSPQMQERVKQQLLGDGKIERKLAEGVTKLVGMVHSQQNKKLPPEIWIPAAIEILYEAADYSTEITGKQVTPEELKGATQYLVVLMARQNGINDEQITQLFAGQPEQQPQPEQIPTEQPV